MSHFKLSVLPEGLLIRGVNYLIKIVYVLYAGKLAR